MSSDFAKDGPDRASMDDAVDGRPTPVVEAGSNIPASLLPNSRRATNPAIGPKGGSETDTRRAPDEIEAQLALGLNQPSSAPDDELTGYPVIGDVQTVVSVEVAQATRIIRQSGQMPALRPQTAPPMYTEGEGEASFVAAAAARISSLRMQAVGSGESQKMREQREQRLEGIKTAIEKCSDLYRKMGIDFFNVFDQAISFARKHTRDTDAQTHLFHHFLSEFTNLLGRHLVRKEPRVIRTKLGQLAYETSGRLDPFDAVDSFQEIESVLASVPKTGHDPYAQLKEAFMDSVNPSDVL